jgi:cell division protein FtsL
VTSKRARVFLLNWTLAVVAAASAFVVHLAMRGRTVQLGYELGKARQEQARLREVKRVFELEAASYKTPERVEIVARTLLGMEPPSPDRIVPIGGEAAAQAKTAERPPLGKTQQ